MMKPEIAHARVGPSCTAILRHLPSSTTRMPTPLPIDALILGGGIAGLWTLDELVRTGRSALLIEAGALGQGQTIWSQGILHGGLKYTLRGSLTESARAIRDMPALWRDCLDGKSEPDLSDVRIRAPHCWLWRTDSLRSRVGMIGARAGLRVAPENIAETDRPIALRHVPGTVARLDEQVISPASLLGAFLAAHADRILHAAHDRIAIERLTTGGITVTLTRPDGTDTLTLAPSRLILAAGNGNAALREQLALPTNAAQVRPLRMVMARGDDLPELNGHCVDGAHTRVTITTDRDAQGRTVWQIGGAVAERGVGMEPGDLIAHAREEVGAVLPGVDLAGVEWATYDAPRAEGRTATGARPEGTTVLEEDGVITAWPTKLVLAPHLAREIADRIPASPERKRGVAPDAVHDWPRPPVATPPWDAPGADWG